MNSSLRTTSRGNEGVGTRRTIVEFPPLAIRFSAAMRFVSQVDWSDAPAPGATYVPSYRFLRNPKTPAARA